jgi:hypothetical protein
MLLSTLSFHPRLQRCHAELTGTTTVVSKPLETNAVNLQISLQMPKLNHTTHLQRSMEDMLTPSAALLPDDAVSQGDEITRLIFILVS